jgi:hypothetical protein
VRQARDQQSFRQAEESGQMSGESAYEAALRSLPQAHSLALRLTDAGVADDVICGYLDIEPECLATFLDMAKRKLDTAMGKALSE